MKARSQYALLLLIALTSCARLRAQMMGPPAQPQQAQYSGSVSGHVYCADTNAPARFARVQLVPVQKGTGSYSRGLIAATGLDGGFLIQNVAPGAYYVSATVIGYLNPIAQIASADLASADPAAQERAAKALPPVSVNGSDGAHTEIRLERGGSISGTVTYDDGSPAADVMVSARPAANSQNPAGMQPIYGFEFGQMQPRTDDYGRYRITGLPPGDYIVMVISQFFGGWINGGVQEASTVTLYAPREFRSTDAKTFTVRAGNELAGADVQIPVGAFHTVSGTVESRDGHTPNTGAVTLTDDKDKTHSFRSPVRADGQFSFLYVPPGSYTLTLTGAAITAPSTTASGNGNGRGRNRTTVVQAYGNATQSVLVENGDLSVVVQAPPVTQSSTSPAP